jgi:hypothetical protein
VTGERAGSTRRERRRMAALLGVAAVGVGLVLAAAALGLREAGDHSTLHAGTPPPRLLPPPTSAPSSSFPVRSRRVALHHGRTRARLPARPVRVIIPAIGVRAPIIRLGLNRDHTLQTPTNFAQAGWWSGGPRPGAPGAAVVVGHVDSKSGPGAFYALRSLRRDDIIKIVGANGRTQRFVVQRLQSFAKAKFPTKLVYGPTRRPRLRLITCGGAFDTATGHYLDNTIVFARPA